MEWALYPVRKRPAIPHLSCIIAVGTAAFIWGTAAAAPDTKAASADDCTSAATAAALGLRS